MKSCRSPAICCFSRFIEVYILICSVATSILAYSNGYSCTFRMVSYQELQFD